MTNKKGEKTWNSPEAGVRFFWVEFSWLGWGPVPNYGPSFLFKGLKIKDRILLRVSERYVVSEPLTLVS